MANESRVFRLPAGMSTQVVANAVEAFLSSAKGMEVQSAETTEGYVVQGRQEKDGWKTIAGMRMATTVQMIPWVRANGRIRSAPARWDGLSHGRWR